MVESSDTTELTYGEYLILSAREGDLESVQECLENEVDVNHTDADGNSALHMASANGHLATVQFLISVGADINK